MGLPDYACMVYRVSQRPYRQLFEKVWGKQAFAIKWAADVEKACSTPGPAPTSDPFPVPLGPIDRGISNQTYDQIALAIAGYEASPDVNVIVGLLGVWFHGGKDLVGDLRQILLAWTIPLGTNGGTKVSADPPVIAPLAFVGLGLIGFLACSRRFSGDSST